MSHLMQLTLADDAGGNDAGMFDKGSRQKIQVYRTSQVYVFR